MIVPGDTARLVCPLAGAFRGLVRVVRIPTVEDGSPVALYTVLAETPILDWLTTGDQASIGFCSVTAVNNSGAKAAACSAGMLCRPVASK